MGLGGSGEEEVQEDEEDENGGHAGFCGWKVAWAWGGGLRCDGYAQRR